MALQTYIIDPGVLRLANLAELAPDDPLAAVCELAESAGLPDRAYAPTQTFSRFFAQLVSSAGFDGMIVPGVRGDPRRRYRNVVIFNPVDWQHWSLGDDGFRMMVAASGDSGDDA